MATASPQPRPTSPGAGQPDGAQVRTRRPRLQVVEGSQLEARPARSARNLILFGLLGLSILFFIFVQFYVARLESARKADASMVGELTGMTVVTPARQIYPRELRLTWEPVSGATSYLVRVRTAEGSPVVDPVEVMGTTWYPPNSVIPGLVPGDYAWTVEAIDSSGIAMARSQREMFTIRGIESRR